MMLLYTQWHQLAPCFIILVACGYRLFIILFSWRRHQDVCRNVESVTPTTRISECSSGIILSECEMPLRNYSYYSYYSYSYSSYYYYYKRWLSLRVTCTNRLNTLRKRTSWLTNAETRHRHANSPSSPRQRHETPRYSLRKTSWCFEDSLLVSWAWVLCSVMWRFVLYVTRSGNHLL